ncbi:hypothetical protein BDZ91DRAFT_711072 [Kalaharituber pfeilii]|nr:hypothetical protein BDZ91DRAFT_711072 [Kalaharituber pfeilii]
MSVEYKNRKAAELLGFFDEGIPPQLYSYWRKEIGHHMVIQDSAGPSRASGRRWKIFLRSMWTLRTLAPRARENIMQDSVMQECHAILALDVAKKIRSSQQAANKAVKQATDAYQRRCLQGASGEMSSCSEVDPDETTAAVEQKPISDSERLQTT